MAYLIDVNVLVALMHERHQHAQVAIAWLETCQASSGIQICRVVQMGALRILTNPTIMQEDVLSGKEFWDGWQRMLDDDRFAIAREPADLDPAWRAICDTIPKRQRIETDVYLAAMAQSGGYTMATFDEGFRKYPGLSLEILRR